MKTSPKPKTDNHEVITKFLEPEKGKTDKYFWPRECKIAKKLLSKFTIEFFRFCPKPDFKVPSLAWFLTENGKKFINYQYFEYQKSKLNLIDKREEIILQDEKVGEDIQITRKPKTLKEFLNLYKK